MIDKPSSLSHLTAVIDKPGSVTLHRRVQHHVVVHLEHVAADTLVVVVSLPVVGEDGPDLLPAVLNHHLPCADLPLAEEAPAVDAAFLEPNCKGNNSQ